MTPRVTIADHSQPVPPLMLTADDARKLGGLLVAEAECYDRTNRPDEGECA
ncbi:hypothetical protein AERO9AM_30623 [Aeromicrobium sp. 9AM]|nr:hypothetical protein AERO9AM_30623 [Aeromicrobium sp. 9AM]